jgi:peptide/nickel transport system permease protein
MVKAIKPQVTETGVAPLPAGWPASSLPRGWRQRLHALRRALRGIPKIPAAIVVAFAVAGVAGPWLTPQDPLEQGLTRRLQPPAWEQRGSSSQLLGTDSLGRDVLSRVIAGARVSLAVALATVVMAGGLGVTIGVLSGYFGGSTDYVLMRITDGFMALPFLVVALALAVVLPPSVTTLIFMLVFFGWANYARIIRSAVLQLRGADYIQLAKVAGCSPPRILWRHVAPNIVNTFVVLATLQLAVVIIAEASLSFLGIGVPPPTPAWGSMLSDGRRFIATAWWISVFPGVAITLVVLSVNVLGDWLRLRLDPRFRQL